MSSYVLSLLIQWYPVQVPEVPPKRSHDPPSLFKWIPEKSGMVHTARHDTDHITLSRAEGCGIWVLSLSYL